MIVQHHILFYDKKSYFKAIKYVLNKKNYSKKEVFGFIMLPKRILIKIKEDFDTYNKITRAGLIVQDHKEFKSLEELEKITKELDIEKYIGIWGKIIVVVRG
jgi:hypothetical protein